MMKSPKPDFRVDWSDVDKEESTLRLVASGVALVSFALGLWVAFALVVL